MTRQALLRSIERALLVAGIALGAWSAAVLLEARYFRELPAPHPTAAVTMLPGEKPSTPNRVHVPLPAGTWVARFEAPSVRLSATVLEGTDDATLRRAAGHIEDAALPGEPGNVGIAGHRDTIFRKVRELKVGDSMELTTTDWLYRYRIAKTLIVKPEDVYVLDPTSHPTLTIVTCYPFEFIGHAPQRYIIQADLEGQQAREP